MKTSLKNWTKKDMLKMSWLKGPKATVALSLYIYESSDFTESFKRDMLPKLGKILNTQQHLEESAKTMDWDKFKVYAKTIYIKHKAEIENYEY